MITDDLATALRSCAVGIYPLEAGTELLIANGAFLHRDDFTSRFITTGTSISDGTTPMADIDWDAAITALRSGELPCSGGERRILLLSASLAGGIPVDLQDTVTGLDDRNTALLITAIQHASGSYSPDNPWLQCVRLRAWNQKSIITLDLLADNSLDSHAHRPHACRLEYARHWHTRAQGRVVVPQPAATGPAQV